MQNQNYNNAAGQHAPQNHPQQTGQQQGYAPQNLGCKG